MFTSIATTLLSVIALASTGASTDAPTPSDNKEAETFEAQCVSPDLALSSLADCSCLAEEVKQNPDLGASLLKIATFEHFNETDPDTQSAILMCTSFDVEN